MPIPIITGSAGVYIREEDISQQDIPSTTSIGAIVFGSKKGTLSPILKTSPTGFVKEFGPSDISWSYGHISALAYFSTQNANNTSPPALWCQRAVNTDACHAGATVMNLGAGLLGNQATEILGLINPVPNGTLNGYQGGGRQIYLIKLTEALNTGAAFSGSITYGATTIPISPTTFATSHAATMQAILTTINAAIAAVPTVAGGAIGMAGLALNDPSQNMILVYGPEGNTITMTASLTGQAGNAATVTLANNIIDIYAENPGDWAEDVGVNITNIDTGIFQRVQLSFSGPLITGNTVSLELMVNGNLVTIPNVVYNTSNDATLIALATAIQTAIPGSTATATIPLGSVGSSARQILIIAPIAAPSVLALYAATITAGVSQALITFSEVITGSAADGTFTINVWQRGNIINPAESYVCTLIEHLDGFGKQMFAEERVNIAQGKSQFIRVRVNVAAVASGAGIDPAFSSTFDNIVWLVGGDDGSLPFNSQIKACWDTFTDDETYRVNILINAGYTAVDVQQHLATIAQNRQDCMAILDQPSDFQDVNDALTYRTTMMNIDSNYVAIYSPDVQIVDANDRKIFVPPSGYVASRYVYTDNNFATWWAPAGTDRGALPNVIGLAQSYKKPDRDVLDRVQINCIRLAKDGSGFVIWGDNTCQVTPSLLSAVNVRRLMLYIENTIAASLERNVFDNNSSQLAYLVQQRINKFLGIVQTGEGIKKFLVLANASNNPGYFADAGQFNVSTYILPVRAAKTILLDAVVTPSDVSFNELIINGVF